MKKSIFCFLLGVVSIPVMAQFDGDGGTQGSKAIAKNDTSIVAWAKGMEFSRDTAVTYGKLYDALGVPAENNTEGVVSLGNGGTVLVTFDRPIVNDYGYDFVVFENAFDSTFMELAFVEVSSDGKNFFRFPAQATATEEKATQTTSHYYNLAGKYSYKYGVGFDLDEIEDNDLLDKNNIRFVRVVDVLGGKDEDSKGNIIYEYDENVYLHSSGFDIAGVGIINGGKPYVISDFNELLSQANQYEIISEQNSDYYDEEEELYYKSFKSNGLLFTGVGDMSWGSLNPISWGVSSIFTDTVSLITPVENSHQGYSKDYYTSAALSGADGENAYMFGYYSEWNDNAYMYLDHVSVVTEDTSAFYPQGVYVNQSLNSYLFAEDEANKTIDEKAGWFKLTAYGIDKKGDTATAEIYLIDLREESYIGNRKDWRWFDLSGLGEVEKIHFAMSSNWAGSYGMNIASYVILDNFVYTKEPVEVVKPVVDKQNACDVYEFRGREFTQSGIYGLYDTILDLTINESYIDTIQYTLTEENPSYTLGEKTYDTPGTYIDSALTVNGCDSITVLILAAKSNLTETESVSDLMIYPNPATDYVSITAETGSNVVITDMNGRCVKSFVAKTEHTELSGLTAGTYLVIAEKNNHKQTKKLIIK